MPNFELLIDQHYFYSVMLKETGGYSLTNFWKQIGDSLMPVRQGDNLTYPNLVIQHRQLQSRKIYSRGKLLDVISSSRNGSGPYLYDIFATRITLDDENYFMLSFPFAALGGDLIDDAINTSNLRKSCDILKVDLRRLVQSRISPMETDEMRVRVVGIEVTVKGDPSVHTLSLEGEIPLESFVYVNYLEEPIRNGNATLEQCILLCELDLPEANSNGTWQPLRARMHIDQFGNFKFYLHVDGQNFIIIPHLIRQMRPINCFDRTSVNPLRRVKERQE